MVLYQGFLALELFFSARGTPFSDEEMAFSPKMRNEKNPNLKPQFGLQGTIFGT